MELEYNSETCEKVTNFIIDGLDYNELIQIAFDSLYEALIDDEDYFHLCIKDIDSTELEKY